jgi:hypothetical protein
MNTYSMKTYKIIVDKLQTSCVDCDYLIQSDMDGSEWCVAKSIYIKDTSKKLRECPLVEMNDIVNFFVR